MAQPPRDSSSRSPYSHAPQTPSKLRQSFAPGSPSPEQLTGSHGRQRNGTPSPPESPIGFEDDGIYPATYNVGVAVESLSQTPARGVIVEEHDHTAASENTRLLKDYDHAHYSAEIRSSPASSTNGTLQREGSVTSDSGRHASSVLTRLRPMLGRFESWMSTSEGYTHDNDSNVKTGGNDRAPRPWRAYLPYYVPILKCE